jgi:pimeloyl-ACP methyl ester carboxylesterase
MRIDVTPTFKLDFRHFRRSARGLCQPRIACRDRGAFARRATTGRFLSGFRICSASDRDHLSRLSLAMSRISILRRRCVVPGYNVLAVHYRGSWGVSDNFSFQHAIEDADAEVEWITSVEVAAKYRVDPTRIVLIGHSMGGYMALSAAAHHSGVAAAISISGRIPRPSLRRLETGR